ncbi:MAG: hypothetical protein RBU25_07060 [Lentisphaeria bacterium]|nr:hypothetical protein [Lentisphaeria bacterium]
MIQYPDLAVAAKWLDTLDEPVRGLGFYRGLMCSQAVGSPTCLAYALDDLVERDFALSQLMHCGAGYATIAYGTGVIGHRPDAGRRGSSRDVAAVTSLAIDLDLHDPDPMKSVAVAEVMAKATELGLPVSAVVNSGNGLHVYLMLEHPWGMASDDDRLAYAERQRWLAGEFGGDHICDLARCLRLPGTLNLKIPGSPLACRVLHYDSAAVIKGEQVPRLSKTPKTSKVGLAPASGGSAATELPPPLGADEAEMLMARLRRLGRVDSGIRLAMSSRLACNSQSEHDFAAVCALLRIGLSPRQTVHVARAMREVRVGGLTEKNQRADYWARTLANAQLEVTK